MVYVGIDVGGTGLKAGVVDANGKIISKVSCPTGVERGHEAVIADMAQLALKAIEQSGYTLDDVKAIGIGIPGVQDPRTGRVPFCTNLGWHDVPVIELMQKVIDKPVYIDNDATVAALAESVAGVSSQYKDSIFLTLGTGVGGGVILNGKVYSGTHGVGSELGHMIVVAGGDQCTCGNRGCWERYASATALIRMGHECAAKHPESVLAGKEKLNAKDVMDAAKANDPAGLEAFDQYTTYLAMGMVNIINFMDPEVIVIGGGVSAAGEFLLKPIREKLAKMVFYKAMPYASIELATLGNDAGIIGAAMLGR